MKNDNVIEALENALKFNRLKIVNLETFFDTHWNPEKRTNAANEISNLKIKNDEIVAKMNRIHELTGTKKEG